MREFASGARSSAADRSADPAEERSADTGADIPRQLVGRCIAAFPYGVVEAAVRAVTHPLRNLFQRHIGALQKVFRHGDALLRHQFREACPHQLIHYAVRLALTQMQALHQLLAGIVAHIVCGNITLHQPLPLVFVDEFAFLGQIALDGLNEFQIDLIA